MNLYFEYPYLNTINVKAQSTKLVKGKNYLFLEKNIALVSEDSKYPSDQVKINGQIIKEFGYDKGLVYFAVPQNLKANQYIQEIDIDKRLLALEEHTGAILVQMLLKKLFNFKSEILEISNDGFSLLLDQIENQDSTKEQIDLVLESANNIIDLGLDIKTKFNENGAYASIESIANHYVDYPLLANTSEIRFIYLKDYKLEDGKLSLNLVAGKKAIEDLNMSRKDVLEVKKQLGSDKLISESVKEVLEENKNLKLETEALRDYVYTNYLENTDLESFEIGNYKVTNHLVENIKIVDLENFSERIKTDIVFVIKDNGEYSNFTGINRIQNFDLERVFKLVSNIYPFEINKNGNLHGKILSDYKERFRDAFNKYLRDCLRDFQEVFDENILEEEEEI